MTKTERLETLMNIRHLCYRYLTQHNDSDKSLDNFCLKPKSFFEAINSLIKIEEAISISESDEKESGYLRLIKWLNKEDNNYDDENMPF